MDAIDCQGFAGGFTMGAVQAGFRLVGKRELKGGFGVESCEANRHLLGDDWTTEVSEDDTGDDWTPYHVPLVFGNPPCSGFSLLSAKQYRGVDSPINSCMWSLIRYASRCRPEVVIFESVQPAYKQGRVLMQRLRDDLEARTGDRYDLVHVLHNACRLGGAAIRRRYFFVASRVPFGVEDLATKPMPLWQTIGDLTGLANTPEEQPYRHPPLSWWARRKRTGTHVVNGHISRTPPAARRAYDLMEWAGWDEGETISDVARRCWQRHGRLPPSWNDTTVAKLVETDFAMGYHQMHRMRSYRPATVMTGGAAQLVLHPTEPRLLTQREIARIQGFPDDWDIVSLVRQMPVSKIGLLWGKGIPVESGRWIATWARESIEGRPGSITGEEVGDRERTVDLSKELK